VAYYIALLFYSHSGMVYVAGVLTHVSSTITWATWRIGAFASSFIESCYHFHYWLVMTFVHVAVGLPVNCIFVSLMNPSLLFISNVVL